MPELLRAHWERVSRSFLGVNLAWESAPAWDQMWSLMVRLHKHTAAGGDRGSSAAATQKTGKASSGHSLQGEGEDEVVYFSSICILNTPLKCVLCLPLITSCVNLKQGRSKSLCCSQFRQHFLCSRGKTGSSRAPARPPINPSSGAAGTSKPAAEPYAAAGLSFAARELLKSKGLGEGAVKEKVPAAQSAVEPASSSSEQPQSQSQGEHSRRQWACRNLL